MSTPTRAQLRARAQVEADMEKSKFVSDDTWNTWLFESAQELYDLLITANKDFETTSQTFTISSGDTWALPSNFYFLRGVERKVSDKYLPISPIMFEERGAHQFTGIELGQFRSLRYLLFNSTLQFLPPELAAGDYRLYYVPLLPDFVDDTSTFNGRNGWDSFIVFATAERAIAKEEGDTTKIEKLKAAAYERITRMSSTRSQDQQEHIVNVRHEELEDYL
jgi:hypothetical protein